MAMAFVVSIGCNRRPTSGFNTGGLLLPFAMASLEDENVVIDDQDATNNNDNNANNNKKNSPAAQEEEEDDNNNKKRIGVGSSIVRPATAATIEIKIATTSTTSLQQQQQQQDDDPTKDKDNEDNDDDNEEETKLLVDDKTNDAQTNPDDDNTIITHHHTDTVEDSFLDPTTSMMDPSCAAGIENENNKDEDCFSPPESTIETETVIDATCLQGGGDHHDDDENDEQEQEQICTNEERIVDKHWGSNKEVLFMRDRLRALSANPAKDNKRPPIFLLPGLASTRLVAWKFKRCSGSSFLSNYDIKVQDNVWLNIHLVLQMGTSINVDCMKECLKLGLNQTDNTDDWETGCKLRPDEGLDAIASLAPGGIGSNMLIGGTNTVYAWLIQWLADNLGYDVSNIVGLPYDWRLTPNKMEERDGFYTMMRKRIEGSVIINGSQPGIMVAHSMGNIVFRYFLEWLRQEMRKEAYNDYIQRAKRRAKSKKRQEEEKRKQQKAKQQQQQQQQATTKPTTTTTTTTAQNGPQENGVEDGWMPGWMTGVVTGFDEIYDWLMMLQEQEEDEKEKEEKNNQHHHQADNAAAEEDEDDDDEFAMPHRHEQFWELAVDEGDAKWAEWIQAHIWTYVGLSAPHLGAMNPLRAVISGENMGLPITDAVAREMEVTFGSTHTINPISTSTGFCDSDDDDDSSGGDSDGDGDGDSPRTTKDDEPSYIPGDHHRLACLDDITNDIDLVSAADGRDPWKHFPALKAFMKDRVDWNSGKPMIDIEIEHCQGKGKNRCKKLQDSVHITPKEIEDGQVFDIFNEMWPEEGDPLLVKKDQLQQSFWSGEQPNILNHTWDRPLIKHVIMAYGVDVPTEVGYIYNKKYELDKEGNVIVAPKNQTSSTGNPPSLKKILTEHPRGELRAALVEPPRLSLVAEAIMGQRQGKQVVMNMTTGGGKLARSGDGSVPYLSLSWAHTWLLHAARARRFSKKSDHHHQASSSATDAVDQKSALDFIAISHRPIGATEWVDGPPPKQLTIVDDEKRTVDTDADTGTDHPHGTRYKPEMVRYHNVGKSRKTGIEYTTSVIEAIGVEHKEATRNYDILAAVFTDVLQYMHDDLKLV